VPGTFEGRALKIALTATIAAAPGSNDDWDFNLRFKALRHTLSPHGTGHPDPTESCPGAVADGG
jgi:hypothetical protein